MRRFSKVVSKVHRMIKVEKLVKNLQIIKCCDQGELNDQSGQGEKSWSIFKCCDQSLVYVVLCCEVKILSRFW